MSMDDDTELDTIFGPALRLAADLEDHLPIASPAIWPVMDRNVEAEQLAYLRERLNEAGVVNAWHNADGLLQGRVVLRVEMVRQGRGLETLRFPAVCCFNVATYIHAKLALPCTTWRIRGATSCRPMTDQEWIEWRESLHPLSHAPLPLDD